MNSSEDPLKYVLVVCPTCRARLHPEPEESERIITCPDCFVDLRVPSRAEAEARWKKEQRRARVEEVEPYELTSRPQIQQAEPAQTTISCPHCGVRLTPILERRERTILCPDCFEEMRVPARADAPALPRKKRRRVSQPAEPADDFTEDFRKANVRRRTLADVQAEIRQEEEPDPPTWTFFSRVFDFPWRSDTVSRWAWMTLGWIATGLLGAYLFSLGEAAFLEADKAKGITLAFFALPAIWVTIWTTSYSAACCVAVIMDTGNGNDRITAWPDPNWRDWALELMRVGFVLLVVQAVAMVGGRIFAPLAGSVWLGTLAASFFLFPFMLLSSLEADSPWVPVSGPILKSLTSHWWAWLVFYGLTGAMLAVWLTFFVVGFGWARYLTVLAAAPLFSAMLLIDARLLGRLAWRASLIEEGEEESGTEGQSTSRREKVRTGSDYDGLAV